jgi:hypothetical protein
MVKQTIVSKSLPLALLKVLSEVEGCGLKP